MCFYDVVGGQARRGEELTCVCLCLCLLLCVWLQGEELTYDYKFPIEEDKIVCLCGMSKCRKYLN